MDDSNSLFTESPSDDIGVLSKASRRELLDISSNAVVRNPVEPTSSSQDASQAASSQADDDVHEPDPALRICAEEEDNLHVVLAMNEAMGELVDNMIEKAEAALRENLEKQKVLEERKKIFNSNAAMIKRKVPVGVFMPPYFKDQFNMCPPQNAEMKRKLASMVYDPLLKEEKRWSEHDLINLQKAVKNDLIEQKLLSIYGQRDLIHERIREANATTTPEERVEWNEKLDAMNRKIEYTRNLSDNEVLQGADYGNVDWARIAMVNFKGQRTPSSLRLKWCNEQCPQWSKEDWTASEVKKLNELANNDFVSWTLIASQLGTRRTPWQCFEKYKSEISSEILKREWTQEEDERLLKLVESLQLNGSIQWDKVTYHMAGRTRQQCRTRFMRTLDKTIKHGRWTDEEDLLLMCSIGRYGAKDWRKVAKGVPGRNDGQCRERWVNVLDRANRCEEWTMEEDEKLLYAVNMFGKGQWAKISTVLPGRNQRVCKARFRSLLTTKMRICAAQLSKIREAQVKYPGTSRSHLRKQKEGIFREFNQLTGGNDETGENFCRRARSLVNKGRFNRLDDEVRRVVEQGLEGITKKYENRERQWSEMSDDSNAEDLFNGIEQTSRTAAIRQQQWLPVEFDPEVSEADKCQRLTEALCQVIDKQDQLRSVSSQEAYESRAKVEVAEKLRRILEDAVCKRVQTAMRSGEEEEEEEGPTTSKDAAASAARREAALRREMASAADAAMNDMLHPTATTAHAAEMILAELPRITQVAAPLLSSTWNGEKLSSIEEVLAHLEESLKHNKEYVEMKELLRCLLIEPFMLIHSLEDDDKKKEYLTEEYNRARDQLMGDVKFGKAEPYIIPKKTPPSKTARTPANKNPARKTNGASHKKKPQKIDQKPTTVGEEEPVAPPLEEPENMHWGEDHEEFPIDWDQGDTVVGGDTTVAKEKDTVAGEAVDTVAGEVEKEDTVQEKNKPAATPRAKTSKKTPAKKNPAKKRKAAEVEEGEEREEEEEEDGEKEWKPPVSKKGRGRPRKSPLPEEQDTMDEEEAEEAAAALAPVKRTRSSQSTTPAREINYKEQSTAEDTEEEMVVKPPVKKGRSTRNSIGTTPASELKIDDVTVEKKDGKPAPKKGRSTRNSMSATPIDELIQGDTVASQDTVVGELEDTVEKEDTVAKEKDMVASQDTVDGQDETTVPTLEDTVASQKEATDGLIVKEAELDEGKEEDTVTEKDTVGGDGDTAMETVEGDAGDTVGEPQ